jgi:hypothetical protein
MPKSFQDEFDTASGVGGKHLAPKRALDYIVSFLTLTFLSAALAGEVSWVFSFGTPG